MSVMQSQYDVGLDKTPANYVPLTPLSFIARSAAVYPNHVSAVYEGRSYTWAETYQRCRRFASYLDRCQRPHLGLRDHRCQRQRSLFERLGRRRAKTPYADIGIMRKMLPSGFARG